ncbi:hypothetical protein RvY_09724 [Ramazzottius varieornatus]|uniref:C3H1-type domain-containing protein n=1 Tax=Ramazzottius varieornatus TaxID=947166 RepID=A0A1D1VJC4_RAMVA|nr:hypothetical protein RvY_09724 [Ramazzottius varieornatus]
MLFNIEDEYALTAWISLHLDPITSKDPKQTARYVVAFVKKSKDDKDVEALRLMYRKRMLDFIDDKDRLYDFCDDLIDALKSGRYMEVREHPSYNTLLEETGPLTPSNKEFFPNVKEEDRRDMRDRDRSRSPKARRNRPRTPDDDETDEAIEDKPPVQIKTSPEQVQPKAVVNSTISVVDDALAKRLGKRPAHGRLSCKDFNEKGFCMRGQFCPYDHGTDPVVWQNAPRPQMEVPVIRYPPPRMPVMPAPPRLPMPGFPPLLPPGIMRPVMGRRIRPDGPPLMPQFMRPPKPGPPPNMQRPNMQRENIVGIPQDEMLFRGGDFGKRENENRMNEIPPKRLAVGDTSGNNCSLEIQNIPPQLNNITALNAHFNKYGPMTNVQVSYNNHPGTALVTFSTPDAAMRAFSSPEPVLNNRFIRISWHNDNKPQAPIQLKRTVTFMPTNPPPAAPVVKKTETTEQLPTKPEETTNPVAPGFTSGFHLRLSPVGAPSSRGRASRYMRGSVVRHERPHAVPDQQQVLSAHHKLIFLSLQVSKAEGEVEKAQAQISSCDEVLAKLNTSIQSYQQTSDKTKARLDSDPNGPKAAEISGLLEKFVNQIKQWQEEVRRKEEERSDLVKGREEAEAMLSAARKRLNDAQKNIAQADASVEEVDQKFSETSLRSRANGRVARTPRGATRGGRVARRSVGATRARRPARGQPFNRSVDRRPKRLRLSGFEKEEKHALIGQVEEIGGVVEASSDPDDASAWITARFNTRFDAEQFLRNVSQGDKKPVTTWIADEEVPQPAGEHDMEANAELENEVHDDDSNSAFADVPTDLMDNSALQDTSDSNLDADLSAATAT